MDLAEPLTALDEARFQADDAIVQAGARTFVEVGLALCRIRDGRTYVKHFGSFDAYVRTRLGFGRANADRMITAAKIVGDLAAAYDVPADEVTTTVVTLPQSQNAAFALNAIAPSDRPAVWQEAVESAPNGKPTAAHVERVVEQRQSPPAPLAVHYLSATPEWYTPRHIIQRVIDMFGVIDLDPCSNSRTEPNVPAQLHYTEADNGLALQWHGYVYMNPPYGDEITPWIPKLIAEHTSGRVPLAVALLPARTDTDWFAPLFDYPICFVHGRLRFSGATNSAPFPSALVYFGDDVDSFVAAFGDLGPIVVRRTQPVMGAM